ncbi:MAG TPA: NrfD/PsrC family molybdoenzyme membrane anchor subunit [Vicinamibacterales bacterium]|nr:NrfD/PsrC family molybdoenzyme membrane anchor subunit [Vicinamibacterales bacterium]
MTAAATTTGYRDRPLLKAPVWTWEIPLYFFIGGLAGLGAVIAAAARAGGADATLIRDARLIAFLGAAISPLLLISDLGRPGRFLYMLRVFKRQSAMSVGVWTLVAFSGAATASLALHFAGITGPVSWVADAVGAVMGAVLATYTGVLLGVTAIPAWAHHVRVLPIHFGASSLGATASLLELAGHRTPALNAIAIAAALAEAIVMWQFDFRGDAAARKMFTGSGGRLARAGNICTGVAPLLLRGVAGWVPAARAVAAVLTLGGSLVTRFGWIAIGRTSARS